MSEIINGKELAKSIRLKLKEEVNELKNANIRPKLAVIMVGNDKASKVYVKNKSKACEEIGIENNDVTIHGILVQNPLPEGLDANEAFRKISPKKDVDGFHPVNVGKLSLNQDCFVSCTPYGIIKMLETYNIPIEGAYAVIIGRSNIVGKPLAKCLLNKNATVTVCHSRTKNLKNITKQADILISAIGKPKFVTKEMVKEGATVIDVGINRMNDGKLIGDVDFENIKEKVSYITPVPGGVGPMTIAMLMHNVVKASKQH